MAIGRLFLERLAEEIGDEKAEYVARELVDLIGPIIRAGDSVLEEKLTQMGQGLMGSVDSYQYAKGEVIVAVRSLSHDAMHARKRHYRIPHDTILGDEDIRGWAWDGETDRAG